MAVVVICRFLVRAERTDEFAELLELHWPLLKRHDLVTDFEPIRLRRDEDDGPVFVEIFEWKDADASSAAHERPEVAAIWARMGELVEDRGDQRKWEFPHYTRLG
ncbi:MAG: hypothetical protein OER88_00965 [Planctomycetota bacterium]|nr:hypothetical protein [Planctomycetota bacterium]